MRWFIPLLALVLLMACGGSSEEAAPTPSPTAEPTVEATPVPAVEATPVPTVEATPVPTEEPLSEFLRQIWADVVDLFPESCRDSDHAYTTVVGIHASDASAAWIAEDVRELIQFCKETGAWLGD